jgi:hypothetical protein
MWKYKNDPLDFHSYFLNKICTLATYYILITKSKKARIYDL